MVERRTSALRAVRARHGPRQVRTEQLEIHDRQEPLEVVALGRELLQPLIDVEEPSLTPHRPALVLNTPRESHPGRNREVLGGVQLVAQELHARYEPLRAVTLIGRTIQKALFAGRSDEVVFWALVHAHYRGGKLCGATEGQLAAFRDYILPDASGVQSAGDDDDHLLTSH